MKPTRLLSFALTIIFLGLFTGSPLPAQNRAELLKRFENPSREYASSPLWVWNDMLTEEQIRSTMRDLASQRVRQVFVHPRPGLMTPYLSDDWFRLWRVALDEAERLDMNVWIYDENSYPSGFAGGLVPEAMPESRGQGLHLRQVDHLDNMDGVVVAFRLAEDGTFENVTEKAKADGKLPQGRWLVGTIQLAGSSGWFGGKYYVDLIKTGVTQKFIEITMEAYKREIGDQFGRRVPGWFTDEPHLQTAGGLTWNDEIPTLFEKRWGYSLVDNLPCLVMPVGDWQRVRHNYQQLMLELFIDRWARPCSEFCDENNLQFTGHYWEHGWPGAGHGPDNMAMYAWHQRPAIDNLMNQYSEGVHGQFGNSRTVKELSTVANQLDRERTLCETYGAGGWDLRYEDMKRIGDWLFVLGVNTLDEHLSYITIRGARKRDHPQSFSYHTPWWEGYHTMANYFTRLSAAMSAGKQVNHILLMEPTTTGWIYQGEAKLGPLGDTFQDIVNRLEQLQAEYDIGCEDIIARHGRVEEAQFCVGPCKYDLIVLPPYTENLNGPTLKLLQEYVAAGGTVLCCGPAPTRIDGQTSDAAEKLAQSPSWKQMTTEEAMAAMRDRTFDDGLRFERTEGDAGLLFHHRRRLDDGELLLLVNTSITDPTRGSIVSSKHGAMAWDPFTGREGLYPFAVEGDGVRLDYDIPPCGSLLLFLGNEQGKPFTAPAVEEVTIAPQGEPQIAPRDLNVLTLDFVDVAVGDQSRENMYFYPANQWIWKQNGMDRDPWDSCVQLRDQLITKTFPPESGFTATYRFTIEEAVPKDLEIVIERPDLYTITCNGRPVAALEGQWWLDKAFGRIPLEKTARVGENEVTLTARPMTMFHELESAYLRGDFSLRPVESGFVVCPPRPMSLRSAPEPTMQHSFELEGVSWLTNGIIADRPAEQNDTAPGLVFDLGGVYPLDAIRIWNYNEINLTQRGVKDLKITASTDSPDKLPIDLGTFQLDQALSGSTGPSRDPAFPQTIQLDGQKVRYIRFDILSNYQGVTYPADATAKDNAYVGLSEVRFLTTGDDKKLQPIAGVKIARCSSELTGGNFDRRAVYLIDGNGLLGAEKGWNAQGRPFYPAGVDYTERFQLPEKLSGRYRVHLPDWYGSTAKITVNGKEIGFMVGPAWDMDVTDALQAGENEVTVTVIGTLKNMLGPHHVGRLRGSAWPGSFQQGPATGPPPGAAYDTIGYGLFDPFVLIQQKPVE